ncbi:hypothetical protein GGD54_003086 [Rhizobium tropici]|uniref:Uncharacterized protein n=1 Tax=Rhizobium tropici TaxID=398 RepID=A0ABR6R142_RHITR|nr:hypothetical protein [Rhizobium tropici]MBB5593998.1 hypothetical protein [Rhizobium tropici]MBB6492881.1 hypothetical protein [Rhizobium tropici]
MLYTMIDPPVYYRDLLSPFLGDGNLDVVFVVATALYDET